MRPAPPWLTSKWSRSVRKPRSPHSLPSSRRARGSAPGTSWSPPTIPTSAGSGIAMRPRRFPLRAVRRSQKMMPWTYAPDTNREQHCRAGRSAKCRRTGGCVAFRPIKKFDRRTRRASPRTGCTIGKYVTARPSGPPRRKPSLSARYERMFPGEGIDLVSNSAMPADITVSIEVPTAELAKTMDAKARAQRAHRRQKCDGRIARWCLIVNFRADIISTGPSGAPVDDHSISLVHPQELWWTARQVNACRDGDNWARRGF